MTWRVFVSTSLCLLALFFLGTVWVAQAADITVTLGPGQEATIPLRLWCLDYGKPFPAALGAPGPRAEDEVITVLQTAIARDAVISDIYQTELAIWRVRTGRFNDYAGLGFALAEEIYDASTGVTVAPLPADVLTLDRAVAEGQVSYAIHNFGPVTETLPPEVTRYAPFFGKADLVLSNPTRQAVTFLFAEGTVFPPAGGEYAQALVSHVDVEKPTILPEGGASSMTLLRLGLSAILPWLGLCAVLLMAGWAWRRSR